MSKSLLLTTVLQPNEEELQWGVDGSRDWDDGREDEISKEEALRIAREMEAQMNDEQFAAFEKLFNAFKNPDGQRCFFLDVSHSAHVKS